VGAAVGLGEVAIVGVSTSFAVGEGETVCGVKLGAAMLASTIAAVALVIGVDPGGVASAEQLVARIKNRDTVKIDCTRVIAAAVGITFSFRYLKLYKDKPT
jgi:hypothetical protein